MRITEVRVRKYRCLRDLSLNIDDYTALVGPNGSGKSSLLYALNWFFNGGALTDDDVHLTAASEGTDTDSEIDVEVSFEDLSSEDRRVLGRYGRGATARFRRTWSQGGKEKMIGNSRQGPGFAAIRAEPPITELRGLYRAAREQFEGLPDVTRKQEILDALTAWEDDPSNAGHLEEIEADDASHMMGFAGEHVLARRVRMILIPASTDIGGDVLGSSASLRMKPSPLLERSGRRRTRTNSRNSLDPSPRAS